MIDKAPDRVYLSDTKGTGYCVDGQRRFFEAHRLDWRLYVREGVTFEELERTGDAIALAMIERAKRRGEA